MKIDFCAGCARVLELKNLKIHNNNMYCIILLSRINFYRWQLPFLAIYILL